MPRTTVVGPVFVMARSAVLQPMVVVTAEDVLFVVRGSVVEDVMLAVLFTVACVHVPPLSSALVLSEMTALAPAARDGSVHVTTLPFAVQEAPETAGTNVAET